jgi:hypothetical protein
VNERKSSVCLLVVGGWTGAYVLTKKGAEKRLFCQLGQTINRKCAAAISGLEQMIEYQSIM